MDNPIQKRMLGCAKSDAHRSTAREPCGSFALDASCPRIRLHLTYEAAQGLASAIFRLAFSAFMLGMVRPAFLRMRSRRKVAITTLLTVILSLTVGTVLVSLERRETFAVVAMLAASKFVGLVAILLGAATLLGLASPALLGLASRGRVLLFALAPSILLFRAALAMDVPTSAPRIAAQVATIPTAPAPAAHATSAPPAPAPPAPPENVAQVTSRPPSRGGGMRFNAVTGDATPIPASKTVPTPAPDDVTPEFRSAYEINYPPCRQFREETLREFDTRNEVVAAEHVSREFRPGGFRQGAFAGCLDGLLRRRARFRLAKP